MEKIKKKCEQALRDLTLIALKSSSDELNEIFNEDSLRGLLYGLFLMDKSDLELQLKPRSADLQLASIFVSVCIHVCISEYEKWNKDTPESSTPTIDYLKKAIAICKEIGYKHKLDLIEKDSIENKLKFICIWEEISHKHLDRFVNYLMKYLVEIMGIRDPVKLYCDINNPKVKEFSIIDLVSSDDDLYLGKVTVNIEPPFNKGEIKFYDKEDKEIKSFNDKNEEIKYKVTLKKFNSQTALYG